MIEVTRSITRIFIEFGDEIRLEVLIPVVKSRYFTPIALPLNPHPSSHSVTLVGSFRRMLRMILCMEK